MMSSDVFFQNWGEEGSVFASRTFQRTIFDQKQIIEDPHTQFWKKMSEDIVDRLEYLSRIILSHIWVFL